MTLQQQVLFAAIAVLLVGLGIPMARRRVKPNRWYGFRVPATFADDHVWYEANAMAGRDLVALGALLAVMALVLPHLVQGAPREGYLLACVAVLVGGSAISTLRTWRYANRLRQVRQVRGGGGSV